MSLMVSGRTDSTSKKKTLMTLAPKGQKREKNWWIETSVFANNNLVGVLHFLFSMHALHTESICDFLFGFV